MELRHLRYFVAVSEELHFGRAAKRLCISQPPLTQQIQKLESELNATLFDRSRRSIRLTPAGTAFYGRAVSILQSAELAANEARQVSQGKRGTLTLGFMSAVMLGEFPPFLRKFHRLYPSVELLFRQMRSDEQYEALLEGNIDAGYVDLGIRGMSRRFYSENIVFTRVLHERLFVALAIDHALSKKTQLSIADLKNEQFVALERHIYPSHYDKLVSRCEQAGFSPNIVAMADQTPSVMTYVASGIGVNLAPECVIHSWSQHIVFIPLKEKAFVDVHMITKGDHPSTSLHALKKIVETTSNARP